MADHEELTRADVHALAAIRWMVLMAVAAIAGCATVPSPPAAVPKPHPATAVDCRGPAIAKALRGTYTIATQVKRVQGFGIRERERERWKHIDGWKMWSFIRSSFVCTCPNPIAAGPDRAYGRIVKTMVPALLDFLNPELPNPET